MQADRRGQSRAGAQARVDSDRLLGRTLDGRYRLTSRIARGGMAAVYEAIDLRLDRTVAVKVMHAGIGAGAGSGLGDESAYAARFVREARAAARLSHPNVVAVYDQGEDDGSPYLVMELVPGHTLRDTITEQSPMAPQRALAVLEPVLAALAAAHRAGLVHRDVKPENVLISDEGAIKVADFGLARAVTADTQHTSTGVLIGTVSYIAPEIVTEGRADARADVYSAGVLLYELLTGRKPHEGETPIQVAYKHVHEDVAPPSRLVPGLPAYVDALVARATARDPGLRPADAGVMLRQTQRVAAALAAGISEDTELTADLSLPARASATAPQRRDEHLDHTRTVVRSAPVPVRLAEPPRRRRRGPLLVALAVLLVAAVGVGAWWFGYARYTSTPGVLGLTQAAATARLEKAGLDVAVGSPAYSDTIQAGRVLRTEPGAGGRVLHGGTVTIVVSKGVEQYRLPDLAGKSVDQAQDALIAIKMAYGKAVGQWSDTVPAGQVIRSDPAAGTVLRPGTPVDVWVSKGRQPIKVADWTGKPATAATGVLEKAGLVVDTEGKYSDTVPEGRVISQSPDAGTLYKGDTVSFVVSRGPELVEVPSVTGHGIDSATKDLQAAGFKVDVQHYMPYFGLGFVMKQDHAGDKVRKGSTIRVWIS